MSSSSEGLKHLHLTSLTPGNNSSPKQASSPNTTSSQTSTLVSPSIPSNPPCSLLFQSQPKSTSSMCYKTILSHTKYLPPFLILLLILLSIQTTSQPPGALSPSLVYYCTNFPPWLSNCHQRCLQSLPDHPATPIPMASSCHSP